MKLTITESEVSDSCQRVVERMGRAKWITVFAGVTPHFYELELTELGKRKIKKLAKSLAPYEATVLDWHIPKVSFFDRIQLWFRLRIYAADLFLPLPSRNEELALVALLAMESYKLRLGEDR